MTYQLSQFNFDNTNQILGQTPAGQNILLGGFSGLFFEKEEGGKYYFVTVPDRGSNGEPTDTNGDGINERPFALPDYQARIIRLEVDPNLGTVEVDHTILLTRADGTTPITGKPNLQAGNQGFAYTDEMPIDLNGNVLTNDSFGADLESIIIAPDGTFWMSDEYRPAIYHFEQNGVLIDRFIPMGTASANGDPTGTYGTETLPEVYAQRRSNRGFEGMALDTENNKLYAWIQSPIDNPDLANDGTSRNSQILRILEVDPTNGQPTGEYIQILNDLDKAVDKIGDAVYKGEGKFLVNERDSAVGIDSEKFVFEVDITNATNILGMPLSTATEIDALELKTEADLIAMEINPVEKTFLFNVAELGYLAGDKTEGLALLPDGKIAIINDNDFGLLPNPLPNPPDGSAPLNSEPVPIVLGIIEEIKPPKNIVISADGLTFRFLKEYLENGQLDANTGLGYLASKGVFVPSTVITPTLTAPSHIAIATGSTAAHNNINANSFHLVKSPFNSNISGFGAPIGGYDAIDSVGEHDETNLTAEPLWVNLLEAGKTVVAATFPGADGATVTLSSVNPPVVIQSNDIRTVDYTVPFGAFGGIGAQGFSLTGTAFNQDATQATLDLSNLGIAFFSTVKVANLETITASSLFGGSDQDYDIKVAVIDTTDDSIVNYDQAIVYDDNTGITVNNVPPSTGSAFLNLNSNIAPFYFEGSKNKAGASYILTELAEDLSTVHLIRTSANYIPRPANNPQVLANVDNINNSIGFWRPQPDFRIAQRISPGLGDFSDIELETAYAALDKTFIEYQTDVFLHAISQQNTDLALGYLEEPDGSTHQFLLTDSRQPTDSSDPNSIGEGQETAKVARYQNLVLDAYQTVNNAVQRIIDHVGVDENGIPNSNIIITSDHGFAPFHTAVSINNILANAGFDPNQVRAVSSGPAVNIYINVAGREADGSVPLNEYNALKQQIIDTLQELFDTNPNYGDGNVPIFDKVFSLEVSDNPTVEEIITASGEFIGQDTGDVFALLSLGYNFDGFQSNIARKDDSVPEIGNNSILSVPTFYGAHGHDPNLTEMQATFIAAGPDFTAETLPNFTEVRSIDIAPTILDILEVEPANTVDGESIFTQNEEPFTLQILHAGDQEGGLNALEDADRFSAVLNALKNQDNDGDGSPDYANTVTLGSGDTWIPGVFYDASETAFGAKGRADILIQNELGFQAIAFGNHEFDQNTAAIREILLPDAENNYAGALFPYLSSNLDFSTDSNLADLVVADGQEASTIPNSIAKTTVITVNGEKIGIVGATTPTLPSISSPGEVGVSPEDAANLDVLASIIQTSVDALTATGIDKVIALTHMQVINVELALAERLSDVDVIIAGGNHLVTVDENDRLRAGDTKELDYPVFKTDVEGNPIAVVNANALYRYVGRLVIDFDENGNIIPESYDPLISGAYATDAQGVTDLGGTPDPEIVAITDTLEQIILAQDSNFFGVTEVYLNALRSGGGTDGVRNQETNLGNLTADANLDIAQEFDPNTVISLKNGGGIRASIGRIVTPGGSTESLRLPPEGNPLSGKPEGGISQIDIQNTLAFNNGLTLVTVTAQELIDILEYGVGANSPEGRFPQVSGIAFSFDLDAPAGDRIESLAIKDENGDLIDVIVQNSELVGNANRTFRMVTLNFLADDGDGYTIPQTNRVDITAATDAPRTGIATFAPDGSEQDALAEYLAETFDPTRNSANSPYNQTDVPRELDERIQNLDFRQDTVLAGVEPPLPKWVSGTAGDDIFDSVFPDSKRFEGDKQLLLTGSGDDTVDVTEAVGGNTIRTASGDDIIYAGTNNRIDAGKGDDLLFLGAGGGNNRVTGGSGTDIFYLTEDDTLLPTNPNRIGDFKASEGDLIGFLATDLTFESLGSDWNYRQMGSNTIIEAFGQAVAILQGINAISLTEDNFTFT